MSWRKASWICIPPLGDLPISVPCQFGTLWSNNKLYINNTTGSALIEGDFAAGNLTFNGNVTASGEISASGDIIADDIRLGTGRITRAAGGVNNPIDFSTTSLTGVRHLTASGDISSSATIKAARIDITGSNASSLGATTFDFGDVTFKSGSTGIIYRHQTGKLDFPDGFKAVFGSTDQLEIYQGASSDSFIDQINTGTLRLRNAGANVFSISRMKSVANRNFETEGDYVSLSSITSVTGSLAVSSSTGTTTVILNNLPTSDPSNAGQLYNDSGVLKVSAG